MRTVWPRVFAIVVASVPLAALPYADETFRAYLALRKDNGIVSPVGIEALQTVIGNRVLEVQGKITGTARTATGPHLLLESDADEVLFVGYDACPEWLHQGSPNARLLIRATRRKDDGTLDLELLGAAKSTDFEAMELEALRKRVEAEAKRPKPPPRPQVRNPGPLTGTIGKPKRTWNLPASEATPYYAGYVAKMNKRLSNAEAFRIAEGVVGFSIRYGVDARLILAMVQIESGFDPSARSSAGAMGLGQLMPGTAQGLGITDAYDSTENLYGTVRTIRGHLERYAKQTGDGYDALVLALAAYNAGSGAVRRHQGVPPYRQTLNYIPKVIALYRKLAGI
ncbi:MAG: lytic transglycosylase domain-containing protein [Fimbriimonadaceae bacterium]|nr:lytic transglycosylase domain-containing protein [Fimbriimonadaceae bacterium]